MIQVFKFGGASLRSAEAIDNALHIVKKYSTAPTVLVVSAMGKMTNAFESLHNAWYNREPTNEPFQHIITYHNEIIHQLFTDNHPVRKTIQHYYTQIEKFLNQHPEQYRSFDQSYDQLIPYGELLSSCIVYYYLKEKGISIDSVYATSCIATDDTWREARIKWDKTIQTIRQQVLPAFDNGATIVITQGFIGFTEQGFMTTLGREGSDFTASIFAYALDAEKVIIWKDVAGLYNADPKKFDNVIFIPHISYHEAAELSYYGQSIIHPRTIKPLQNKNIPLHIRSFLEPDKTGTIIDSITVDDNKIPCFILKDNQMLVSISPRDYSFINEMHLSQIIHILDSLRIRMNVMQNGAMSFSFCADFHQQKLDSLLHLLSQEYITKYNLNLSLLTIRNYNDDVIKFLLRNHKVYLEQRSRHTAQFIIS